MRENIVETWAYYHLPVAHHKHLKSTNMLERFHQEIKHRTLVVRIFPNAPSYLQLVRAPLAAGTPTCSLEFRFETRCCTIPVGSRTDPSPV